MQGGAPGKLRGPCRREGFFANALPSTPRNHDQAVAQKSSPPQCRAELCGTAVIENRAEGDRTAAAVIEKRAADEFPETDFSKFARRSEQQQKTASAACRRAVENEIFEKNSQEGRTRPSSYRTNNNIY